MTTPSIPPAHREAMENAMNVIRACDGTLAGYADAAIATLLQLGYRVAPGLSESTRELLNRAFLVYQAQTMHPYEDEVRAWIAVARTELDALPTLVPQPDPVTVGVAPTLKVRTDLKPQEPAPFSEAAADALFSKLRADLLPQPAPTPQRTDAGGVAAERCIEPGCSFGRVPIGDGLGDCPRGHPHPAPTPAANAKEPT